MPYLKGDFVYIIDRCGYRTKRCFGRVIRTTKAGSLHVERLKEDVVYENHTGTDSVTGYKLLLDENGNAVSTGLSETYISRKGSTPKRGDSEIGGSYTIDEVKDMVLAYYEYY